MTGGLILTEDLIETPTNTDDKENLQPGGLPYTVDGPQTEIVFNLKTDDFASGDVTKIDISTKNVKTVTVYLLDVNGVWQPINIDTPGSTVAQEFLPDELPIVLKPRFKDATKVKIVLTRDNPDSPMEIEVEIWACLEPGECYRDINMLGLSFAHLEQICQSDCVFNLVCHDE